jgi:hypothetical protein
VPVNEPHGDIQERQPAPIHPIGKLLPPVMHRINASCHGIRVS